MTHVRIRVKSCQSFIPTHGPFPWSAALCWAEKADGNLCFSPEQEALTPVMLTDNSGVTNDTQRHRVLWGFHGEKGLLVTKIQGIFMAKEWLKLYWKGLGLWKE